VNAVELSPMTPDACVRRITSDLHTGRSESALCQLATVLGGVATGRLDQAAAELALRGVAVQADPDGYAEAVRQLLGVAVAAL
jgi:hypothetical protein